MDFPFAAKPGDNTIEKFKRLDINGMILVRMMAAQQPVQLLQCPGIVPSIMIAIGGGDSFARMGVVEVQRTQQLLFRRKTGKRPVRAEQGQGGCEQRGLEEEASADGKVRV